jgi:hypothetical protein
MSFKEKLKERRTKRAEKRKRVKAAPVPVFKSKKKNAERPQIDESTN